MDDSPMLDQKHARLAGFLAGHPEAVLAFSGGVDSSLLLRCMVDAGVRVVAVTALSETMPDHDRIDAEDLVASLGVEHLTIHTKELANEAFAANSPDRCFHCKDELFGRLRAIADERGMQAVFDGSNSDDLGDYRPGRRAAEHHGVISPLALCGLGKEEVRALSHRLSLPTWDKPSSPCLSSRFPYGRRITAELLTRVRRAEAFIRDLHVRDLRVRDDGDTARIEVGIDDMAVLLSPENRVRIVEHLKALGYTYVALDLEGFRSGKLNDSLRGGRG